MRTKSVIGKDGIHYGVRFDCPGCQEAHYIPTKPYPQGWTFNGDHHLPTVSPSILIHETRFPDGTVGIKRCHSFVRDGRIEFLSDCGHDLAGKTVDLPIVPKG